MEAGHRVVTYARGGFGDSSRPWDGYDDDTSAADLHALMTELDLTDATIEAYQQGGRTDFRGESRR